MAGRVVVFGATGYTGRLAAGALVAAGVQPVLAGRHRQALVALASSLRGAAGVEPEIAVADVGDPPTVRALVERGDVLLSTVGPFALYGRVALDAALAAGAHYVDSTGEPVFIRDVFERAGPRAEAAGCTLLTGFGHDWVPGNVAGALAVHRANEAASGKARRVDVGYFISPVRDHGPGAGSRPGLRSLGRVFSTGTRASLIGAMAAPGYRFTDGRIATERAGGRLGRFDDGDRQRPALSVGGTEQFCLPLVEPQLRDVDVYLGWFGPASRAMQVAGRVTAALGATATGGTLAHRLTARAARRTGLGPGEEVRARSGTLILAVCRDESGRELATARLQGPVDGYTLTGRLLAWGAAELARTPAPPGAHGPVDAFGLQASLDALASAGLPAK